MAYNNWFCQELSDSDLDELKKAEGYDFCKVEDRVRYADYIISLWDGVGSYWWSRDVNVLTLVTGGWSANEEVIMSLNPIFHGLCWERSESGGKHVYVLDRDVYKTDSGDDKSILKLWDTEVGDIVVLDNGGSEVVISVSIETGRITTIDINTKGTSSWSMDNGTKDTPNGSRIHTIIRPVDFGYKIEET